MDEGDIVGQRSVAISPAETIKDVTEHVTEKYLELLEANLDNLLTGTADRVPQDHSKATYTCRRLPEDNLICWREPTQRIYDLIRATTHPYPGAFTHVKGEKLHVWRASLPKDGPHFVGRVPGRVLEVIPSEGVLVSTGDGSLLVQSVQLAEGSESCAADVIGGLSVTLGH